MINTINNLNFIYDKVCSSFNLNIYLFASTTVNRYSLPKQIIEKFNISTALGQLIIIIKVL